MKSTVALTVFVFSHLGSSPIMGADSLPPTPGFFTMIDVPGASSTSINAISSSGNLAGIFADGTGEHGFADNHGVFTKFDFPAGNDFHAVTGVNDAGQVVGSYHFPGDFVSQGFIYANGVLSPITNEANNLFPHGINNAGEIVGTTRSCMIDVVCESGFVYNNGTLTRYRFPVPPPFSADTSFEGINNNGEVVGTYRAGIEHHGYFYSGAFIFLGDDDFMPYLPGSPNAINDAGQIVGTFTDSNGVGHDFLDSNGSLSSLDFAPTGIDNADQIVGGGNFVFTATPEPASLLPLGSGLIGTGILMRRRRNSVN